VVADRQDRLCAGWPPLSLWRSRARYRGLRQQLAERGRSSTSSNPGSNFVNTIRSADSIELVGGRLRVTGLIAGKLGILERYGVATHGSGGPGQAKVHGHPVISWERVVHVGSEVVIPRLGNSRQWGA
jgi:hypothetical protein